MNPQKYADELFTHWTKSKEGPKHALHIAKNSMEASDPKNWAYLPSGPTFGTKGYGSDKWDMNFTELKKVYVFWFNVYHILKKRVRG